MFFYNVNGKGEKNTGLDSKNCNDGCRISWKKNVEKFKCIGFNALSCYVWSGGCFAAFVDEMMCLFVCCVQWSDILKQEEILLDTCLFMLILFDFL